MGRWTNVRGRVDGVACFQPAALSCDCIQVRSRKVGAADSLVEVARCRRGAKGASETYFSGAISAAAAA
jgi:hypothetical protein